MYWVWKQFTYYEHKLLTLSRPGFWGLFRPEGGSPPPPSVSTRLLKLQQRSLEDIQYVQKFYFDVWNTGWWCHITYKLRHDFWHCIWIAAILYPPSWNLDFSKKSENRQKWLKSKQNQYKNANMINRAKSYCQKVIFFLGRKMKIPNRGKHACQNMVAMVTTSYVNNNLSYEIVPRYILGKFEKFGVF